MKILAKFYNYLFAGNWKLKTFIFSSIICLLFTTPTFLTIDLARAVTLSIEKPKELDLLYLIEQQIQNPFDASIYKIHNDGSHEAKRAFRIALPLLMHYTGLPVIAIIFLEVFVGFYLIFLIQRFLFVQFENPKIVFFGTLAFCFTPFCKMAFYDNLYFDVFAIAALFSIAVFPSLFTVIVGVLVACFTDERSFIASILLGFYFLFSNNPKLVNKFKYPILILAMILISLSIRYYLQLKYGLNVPISNNSLVGLSVLKNGFGTLPYAFFTGFEIFLVLEVLVMIRLFQEGKLFVLSLFLLLFSGSFIASFLILDVTRASFYTFPLILFSLSYLAAYKKQDLFLDYSKFLCLCTFSIPSTFVVVRWFSSWMTGITPAFLINVQRNFSQIFN